MAISDYYAIEWPIVTREWRFGETVNEVLTSFDIREWEERHKYRTSLDLRGVNLTYLDDGCVLEIEHALESYYHLHQDQPDEIIIDSISDFASKLKFGHRNSFIPRRAMYRTKWWTRECDSYIPMFDNALFVIPAPIPMIQADLERRVRLED